MKLRTILMSIMLTLLAVPAFATGTVSGSVTDGSAQPVPGISVQFYNTVNGNTISKSGTTDGTGTYSVGGVANGTYKVIFFGNNAAAQPFAQKWYNSGGSVATFALATPITVSNNTISNVNAVMGALAAPTIDLGSAGTAVTTAGTVVKLPVTLTTNGAAISIPGLAITYDPAQVVNVTSYDPADPSQTPALGAAAIAASKTISDNIPAPGSYIIKLQSTSNTNIVNDGLLVNLFFELAPGVVGPINLTSVPDVSDPSGSVVATTGTSGVISTLPGTPTIGTATAGKGQATVSFGAPATDGGSAITGYTVTASTGQSASGATSPIIVSGLISGVSCTFTVTATNAVGTGSASGASNSVTPFGVPGPPTAVSAARGNAQAIVSFTAPINNGGSPITLYTVTSNTGASATGAASPITVSGLTNGTPYTFTVTATNAAGTGAISSPSASVTPSTTPGAPTAVTATIGNGQAIVSFSAPASNGGSSITLYTVTSNTGISATGGTSPITVTGLTNGTPYSFTVTATNVAGVGAQSTPSASVTPATTPDAPTAVSAVRGNGQATVSFIAPVNNGGSAISLYTVTSNTGISATGANSPIVVTGLTNGTPYTFTVTATNGAGVGALSAPSASVTPATTPGAPTAVSVVRGSTQVTVSFTAPASTGGSAITQYTVTSNTGINVTGLASPIIVTGLTNGTPYTFTVTATNAVGVGAISSPSATVIPATVPDAPTAVSAVGGNAQAMVSFSAPANNGGSAVSFYTVTSNTGISATGANSPIIVTGLTNGTPYTFTVTATNVAGVGALSAPSTSVIPTTTPNAPTAVSAARGNGQAIVSFTAPANNGGSAITLYTVTSNTGISTTGVGSPITVTGLTNGTTYTFTVTATNAVGVGAVSNPPASVTPATTPDAPTAVSAVRGNGQATVSFSAPANNGGSAVSLYTVTSNTGISATGTSIPIIVTGLTNGTPYTFTVTATNVAGVGALSAPSAPVTPATTPGAPTAVSVVRGSTQVTVSFTAPANTGGSAITLYTVTSNTGINVTGLASPITVTGLTNGTPYTFTVTATNAIGVGAISSPSAIVTPATVPDAPTAVSGTRGNAQVAVSFSAPANTGGSVITLYTVTSNSGLSATGASSPIIVTGLTNGTTYTFTVTATNAVGAGAVSSPSAGVTPATVPDAPTVVSAVRGNAQVTVSFTAPVNNGGSVINLYTVSSNTGISASGTTIPITVTGLTNGTTYTFTVTATNAAGTGAASAASASVTPATVPGAATSVVAIPGNGQASVSFIAPASNGGSTITSYTVTSLTGGFTATGTASPLTVNGLTNGMQYSFTVTASNVIGAGTASAASNLVTPATVPDAPTAVAAVASPETASVSFTPAFDGGHLITGYTVTSIPAGGTDSNAGTTALSHVITGLTDATAYTFTVTATSSVGTSLPSAPSNSVTPFSSVHPVLVVSTLADGTYTNNPTLNVSGTVTSANGIASLKVNGNLVTVGTDSKFSTAITLVDGANSVVVVATDGSTQALQTSDTRSINLDRTVPVISNLLPVDGIITNSSNVTVSGNVSETATVSIALNGGTASTVSGTTFSHSVGPLVEGINTIAVSATDLAGNSTLPSSYKITVHLDNVAPALAVTSPTQDIQLHPSTNTVPLTITGTVTDDTSIVVNLAFNGTDFPQTVTSGQFTQAITVPSVEGIYPVVVTATDAAGNVSTVTRNVIFTGSAGDATGNGGMTAMADVIKAAQYIFAQVPLTPAEKLRLDCAPLGANGQPDPNGVIDSSDVILLLRRIVGLVVW